MNNECRDAIWSHLCMNTGTVYACVHGWRTVVNANHFLPYFGRPGLPLNLVFIDSANLVFSKPNKSAVYVFPALGLMVNATAFSLFICLTWLLGIWTQVLCLQGEHFHDWAISSIYVHICIYINITQRYRNRQTDKGYTHLNLIWKKIPVLQKYCLGSV